MGHERRWDGYDFGCLALAKVDFFRSGRFLTPGSHEIRNVRRAVPRNNPSKYLRRVVGCHFRFRLVRDDYWGIRKSKLSNEGLSAIFATRCTTCLAIYRI